MTDSSTKIVAGLDRGPSSDPEWLYAQPLPPIEDLDPAEAMSPGLRRRLIEMRRAAGLSDYPEQSAGRDAAD